MRKPLHKTSLILHLRSVLLERMSTCEDALTTTRASFTSDTKSSAGDKHEVGRAMVQQELDKLEEQHAKLIAQQEELARVPLDRIYDMVAFGSLVATDQGTYFIAIGIGRVEFGGGSLFVISLASPIGQALKDKHAGERLEFNGRSVSIRSIT